MIGTYNNLKLHITSEDEEKLIEFFKRIEKKIGSASIFANRQLELINEATYVPRVIKFAEQEESAEDKAEVERVKSLRDELVDKLHLNCQKALESMVLTPEEFMEIDDLIIGIKKRRESKES